MQKFIEPGMLLHYFLSFAGKLPINHGIVNDFMYDSRSGQYFMGLTHATDFEIQWWNQSEPIWVTASRAGISTALYYWPGCQVEFEPSPDFCVPFRPRSNSPTLNSNNVEAVLKASREYEFVLAYHNALGEEIRNNGAEGMASNRSRAMEELVKILERVLNESRSRIDLNVLVLSDHGMMTTAAHKKRYLEDYVDLSLIRMTVGSGAIKQIIPESGRSFEVISISPAERFPHFQAREEQILLCEKILI